MIAIPKLSHLPFDTLLMGGIGFALGRLAQVNERLSASVLAVTSIANYILFEAANRFVRPFLNRIIRPLEISPEALYTGTNALVWTATILAAQSLDLISGRIAGLGLFVVAGVLATRISLLS